MTSEELGFVSSIIANRGDDTPRLAYADWLDERGGPGDAARAEFIRVQCELESYGSPVPNTDRVCEFAHRERVILHNHEWNWLHAISSELHRGSTDLKKSVTHWLYPHVWRRGFLAELTINTEAWSEIADAMVWHPNDTEWCQTCRGKPVSWKDNISQLDCATCDGKRVIPRPCPPTAQPIERVTLTTLPQLGDGETWDKFVSQWEGVEFVQQYQLDQDYRTVEEAVRQIRGQT